MCFPLAGKVQPEITSPIAMGKTDDAETTRNVTTDAVTGPLSHSVCNMSIFMSDHKSNQSNPVEDLRRLVVDDSAIFVYMKLDFMNMKFDNPLSANLKAIEHIIDPLTWVWAKGGRGKLLLAAPFDFQQLSLMTLSPGVHSLTVKIQSSGCNDSGRVDAEKIQAIKGLLLDMVKGANEDDDDDDIKEFICLEKQLYKIDDSVVSVIMHFTGISYVVMEKSTAFDCWSNGADNKVMRVHTEFWAAGTIAGGIILACFSPLAMSLFIQKNSPENDKNGVCRLSLVSDLPLGLKYVICSYKYNNCIIALIRRIVVILLFTIIPVLISFVSDMDGLSKRTNAISNTGFLPFWNRVLNGVFVASIIYFGQKKWKKLDELEQSEIVLPKYAQLFLSDMSWTAKRGLDPKFWKLKFHTFFNQLPELSAGNVSNVLLAIPKGLRVLFVDCFNTLPLVYCFVKINNSNQTWNLKDPAVAVLAVVWLLKYVATLIYVAEIIEYTFMGFVANADAVGPTVLVVVIVAGYIVGAITGFYDGYCVLFRQVMKVAEDVDEEKKNASSATRRDDDIKMTSRGDGQHENGSAAPAEVMKVAKDVDEEKKNAFSATRRDSDNRDLGDKQHRRGSQVPPPDYTFIKLNTKGMPTLELKLFWLIVEKYRPIREQVALTFVSIFMILFVSMHGISIMTNTDSLSNLSANVKLFSAAILAGLVPIVLRALKSPASQECYDQARMIEIKADILHFEQNDELKSTESQPLLPPLF